MAEKIGPSYQRVTDDIRARIISGEYPVGSPIPSTPKLQKQYEASITVVRRAVEQLRADGILIGHPGKAVYVKALPDTAAAGLRDLDTLSGQVAELQRRAEADADLRAAIDRVEDNLIDLYGKLGFDYPRDEISSRQQQREGTAHG